MKLIVTGLLLLLCFVGKTNSASTQERLTIQTSLLKNLNEGKPQTIVYYGTSLTAAGAWTRILTEYFEALYPGQVTAHNKGGAGMHSGWGVANLDERVLAYNPDVVFLEFSINDAVERFNLTPQQAKSNLNSMIDRIENTCPDCEIILQIMNPVIGHLQGDSGWRPALQAYQENYRQVASERGLLLIDHMPSWTALLESNEPTFREYVPDGIHPTEKGYQAIIMPELKRRLGLLTDSTK